MGQIAPHSVEVVVIVWDGGTVEILDSGIDCCIIMMY